MRAGVLQSGQVGLYDRSYAGVDRAGAVLMGAARHEDIILSNTIHPHAIEEPVSSLEAALCYSQPVLVWGFYAGQDLFM